jgi:hypothetical protein
MFAPLAAAATHSPSKPSPKTASQQSPCISPAHKTSHSLPPVPIQSTSQHPTRKTQPETTHPGKLSPSQPANQPGSQGGSHRSPPTPSQTRHPIVPSLPRSPSFTTIAQPFPCTHACSLARSLACLLAFANNTPIHHPLSFSLSPTLVPKPTQPLLSRTRTKAKEESNGRQHSNRYNENENEKRDEE